MRELLQHPWFRCRHQHWRKPPVPAQGTTASHGTPQSATVVSSRQRRPSPGATAASSVPLQQSLSESSAIAVPGSHTLPKLRTAASFVVSTHSAAGNGRQVRLALQSVSGRGRQPGSRRAWRSDARNTSGRVARVSESALPVLPEVRIQIQATSPRDEPEQTVLEHTGGSLPGSVSSGLVPAARGPAGGESKQCPSEAASCSMGMLSMQSGGGQEPSNTGATSTDTFGGSDSITAYGSSQSLVPGGDQAPLPCRSGTAEA